MVAWRKIIDSFTGRRTALLLFAAYLLHKITFFFLYSLQFADHDQATVWLMASDFATGTFPSLFFYGQNYNIALDALVAAPLVALGLKAHIAVSLSMLLFSILPVWLLWKYSFNKHQYVSASLTTLIFLLAPFTLNYLFSTGINLSVCLALSGTLLLLNTQNKWAEFFIWLMVAFAAFGVVNAMPLLIWMVVYFSFSNGLYSRVVASLGLLSGFGLYKLIVSVSSDALVVHQNFELKNSAEIFLKNIQSLPELFYGIGPILDYAGIFYFIICAFFAVFFINKKEYNIGFANLIAFVFIVSVFSTEKISDHHQNAYFTASRYFISLIGIVLLNVYFMKLNIHFRHIYIVFFITAIINISVFYIAFDNTIYSHIEKNKSTGVMSIPLLRTQYKNAEKSLGGFDNKTIISMDHPTLMYAMQAWNRNCNTLFLPYDRRRKQYLNFYNSELKKVFLLDVRVKAGHQDTADVKGYTIEQIQCDGILLYKIEGSGMKGSEYMEKSGWEWWQRL